MIPRILNFIWIGDEAERPETCLKSWANHHPDWGFKVWGNADLASREWVNARHIRELLKERKWSDVADLMRWELLYDEGGVFLDADSICLRPLSDDLLAGEAFACWENEIERPGLIAAGALGAIRHNPFIGQIVLDLQNIPSVAGKPAWQTVGPQCITDAWRRHRYDGLTVFPSHYFIPRHYDGRVYRGGGRVFADQLWGSTRRNYGRMSLERPRAFVRPEDSELPMITVGMITRNHARWIGEALESALGQDYPNFEIVVVDDGSTDTTPELLAAIDDPRLRVIRKQASNVPDSRNHVMNEARGDYVCWLDSDDVLLPGILRAYGDRALDWPDVAVFYGDIIQIDAQGRITGRLPYENHACNGHLLAQLFIRNRMPNPGTLVRTAAMREIGGFDLLTHGSCDYDLWLRLAAASHRFMHIGREVVKYRWHGDNLSLKGDRYRATDLYILRKMLDDLSMDKLCSDLPWHDPQHCLPFALTRISKLLLERGDPDQAREYLEEAKNQLEECMAG
jgi:mannosyltransferase OCH1-like enzyme/GT2 family glycosyltransferase